MCISGVERFQELREEIRDLGRPKAAVQEGYLKLRHRDRLVPTVRPDGLANSSALPEELLKTDSGPQTQSLGLSSLRWSVFTTGCR